MTDKTVVLDEGLENAPKPNQKDKDPIEIVADTSQGSEPTPKEGARDIDNSNADPIEVVADTSQGSEPTSKEGARGIDNSNAEPMPKLKESLVDDAEIAKIVTEQETPEITLSEDIKSLLEGIDLPVEFKDKALGLFEGAVAARVLDIKAELSALNETAMTEYKTKLAEDVEAKAEAHIAESVAKFLDENKLAVKSNIRTQIAESFMANLLNLLDAHYINVPEGKEDVLESALAKADELQTKLDEQVLANVQLKESAVKAQKALVVESVVKSLTDTQAERVRQLAESVEFATHESYSTKLTAIVESITKVVADKASDFLTEDAQGDVVLNEDKDNEAPTKTVDPMVARLAADMKRLRK